MKRETGQKGRKPGQKNKAWNGALFSAEFLEVVSRLKKREPELAEVIKRGRRG